MAARTILGMRVLAGEERRKLQRQLAFERAEFEREYAGRPVVEFDRERIVRALHRMLDGEQVYISDAFVRETQRRVAAMHSLIERVEGRAS